MIPAETDTYRETLLLLPEPVMVVGVGPEEQLWCEVVNPAWLARCEPVRGGTSLYDNLPAGRQGRILEALHACLASARPVVIDDTRITPQLYAGRVRRLICSAGGNSGAGGDRSPVEQVPAPRDGGVDPNTQALRLTLQQLQTLVDNSPDLITRYDRDWRRLFVNRAVAAVHGRTMEELIGTTLSASSGRHASSGMHPDSAPRLIAAIREVYETGRATDLEVLYLTSVEPVVVVHFKLVPEADPSGRVVDVLTIGRDITRVKRIEEELERSRSRYRHIFDNALDQMLLLEVCEGDRYRIVEANPSMVKAMERPRSEVIGAFQDELMSPESHEALAAAYRRCIEAGGPIESPMVLSTPTGARQFQSTLVPTRDESGRFSRIVSIVRDVTDLEQAERTQRRLNRALQTLSNGNITLIRATDEPSLLDGMCQVMIRVGGYARAWIGYPTPDADEPVVPMASASKHRGAVWAHPSAWTGPRSVLLEVMSTRVAHVSRPRGASGPGSVMGGDPGDDLPHDVTAVLTMPLHHDGHFVGVFVVHTDDVEGFRSDEVALLTELAADLSFGIYNLRRLRERDQYEARLVKAMYATIQALADTTELRDPYTAGHQRRVAQLAEAVGRRLGLSEDRACTWPARSMTSGRSASRRRSSAARVGCRRWSTSSCSSTWSLCTTCSRTSSSPGRSPRS